MIPVSFFEWCEATAIGVAIRESLWAFAAVESVHLLALALIGGSVLVVDMRLLGLALRRHPVAQLAGDAQRWLNIALAVLIVSGIGMFLSESVKCYYSAPFQVKMTTLLLAITFTYTIRRKVIFSDEGRVGPIGQRAVALLSVALWFTVAAAGRWIGFSG